MAPQTMSNLNHILPVRDNEGKNQHKPNYDISFIYHVQNNVQNAFEKYLSAKLTTLKYKNLSIVIIQSSTKIDLSLHLY